MTNITILKNLLLITAEEILAEKSFSKAFSAEGIGSMWENNARDCVDITVYAGHNNNIMVIEPYIVIKVNGEPTVCHTTKEIKEVLKTL